MNIITPHDPNLTTELSGYTKNTELSNNDHKFSAWLLREEWRGALGRVIKHPFALSEYITENGTLCKVLYNNQKCTYTVYLPE